MRRCSSRRVARRTSHTSSAATMAVASGSLHFCCRSTALRCSSHRPSKRSEYVAALALTAQFVYGRNKRTRSRSFVTPSATRAAVVQMRSSSNRRPITGRRWQYPARFLMRGSSMAALCSSSSDSLSHRKRSFACAARSRLQRTPLRQPSTGSSQVCATKTWRGWSLRSMPNEESRAVGWYNSPHSPRCPTAALSERSSRHRWSS